MRKHNKTFRLVAKIIATIFGLLYFYTAGFGIISTETHRGFYLLFTFLLCILLYPASKKRPENKVFYIFDVVVAVLAASSIIYWILEYKEYAAFRAGWTNQWDLIFGLILMGVSLEITRRVMGKTLMILGIIMITLNYYGPYLPGIFKHSGITLASFVEFNYYTDGIFGTIVSVFSTYVMPFLIFGAFLKNSGGGDFFIDLASALTGHVAGGPALIAVGGSSVFGSISGSGVANVVATGSFTIPMMKKVGYSAEFSGAVEAAASAGGQFLPPIMGAAAFILATITETPYSTVILIGLTPALFYYLSLTLMVYFRARRKGLRGLKREELPVLSEVLKKGWYYIFTVVLVLLLIVMGYSPPATAFGATVFVILCSLIRKDTRFNLEKFLNTLEEAARSSLVVGATAGTLGLVMGGLTLSGLGVKFSALILSVGQGNLFITIILIGLIATIVGMGLPTTASYIVMAILAAPSLIQLGIPILYAHMLCLWLSIISNITPPVCVAAFAAASISGGDPMKTGFQAVPLGLFMYLMPFAFIYYPQIFVLGSSAGSSLEVIISFIFATVALAAVFQGWLFKNLKLWERAIYLVSAVFLVPTNMLSNLVGIALFCVLTVAVFKQSVRNDSAITV